MGAHLISRGIAGEKLRGDGEEKERRGKATNKDKLKEKREFMVPDK